jgi:membrane peptidoglycan carboxypeptidase
MGPEDIRQRRYGPSIATGGANLTLFEHTFAFATLANNGEMRGQRAARNYGDGMRKIDPTTILKVTTERGNPIYEFDEPLKEQVVPANYAYLVTSILSDCTARYIIWTCGSFDIGRPYAVKTGTQQGLSGPRQGRDTVLYNWQMGYTPDIAVGVWIGNQDNQPVNGSNFETANAANAVWQRTMKAALRDVPPHPFTEPPGIERAQTIVGRPGSFSCSSTYEELWAAGDVKSPEEQCRIVNSMRPSNAPAISPTPNSNRREQVENPAGQPAPVAAPALIPIPPSQPLPAPATTLQSAPAAPPAAPPGTSPPRGAPQAAEPPPVPAGPPAAPQAAIPVPPAPTPVVLVATGQQPAPGAPPPR